jgi:ATPase subunit of ABC transporter with duplicated ATPase domains
VNSRQYVSWFNFKGRDQQRKVGALSGGERNRVHLAKLLKGGSNLLLLDEPTNDLDVDTLRALEDAILDFAGCAVIISHDRWFLDRVATHILAFEGNSEVVWYEGNYQAYIEDLKKAFGDKLLFEGLTFALPRGGIVGIIGPNGAGKTTLFRMIYGSEKPDGGQLKVGETVQIAYADQSRTLDPNVSAWQEISGGQELIMVGKKELNSRAYLSSFNFRGNDQQKKVGQLSGGERNRIHLAKTLMSGGNVLMLDEPTNDLDVDTLRALEDAILDFAGCAVVISHDRWFLDRVATHILAFEGNSEVVWYEGNYQAYIEDLKKRKGADADQPHRIAYRKLVRT